MSKMVNSKEKIMISTEKLLRNALAEVSGVIGIPEGMGDASLVERAKRVIGSLQRQRNNQEQQRIRVEALCSRLRDALRHARQEITNMEDRVRQGNPGFSADVIDEIDKTLTATQSFV
jgi:hypothetical protein